MANRPIPFDPDSALRTAKRLLLGLALLTVLFVGSCSSVTRIDAGHVGIRVKIAGTGRGVQDIPVVTGWVFFNPLSEQIVQFPTSVQNIVWTASLHEGRSVDESITFSSAEGVNVTADVGLSFHIDPALSPHLYLRFRQADLVLLADGYVRNAVREAFNDVASRMPVQEIYGVGKAKLVQQVSQGIRDILGKDGFIIDQLTINGALRLPENVAQAINRAMEATQNAIQSENQVRQVRAEAEQAITKARGNAEAARQRAQGEADAIIIRARADARANEIIRYSTTATVLQYRAIERWDGKLPMMQGSGQVPLLTFDVGKLASGSDAEREKKLHELLGDDKGPAKQAAEPTDKDPALPVPPVVAQPIPPAPPAPAAPKRPNP